MNPIENIDSGKCSENEQKTARVERSLNMDLELDSDVQAVAEFMMQNIPAAKLVAVARALVELAPLFWGHFTPEHVRALRLEYAPTGSCVPQ